MDDYNWIEKKFKLYYCLEMGDSFYDLEFRKLKLNVKIILQLARWESCIFFPIQFLLPWCLFSLCLFVEYLHFEVENWFHFELR